MPAINVTDRNMLEMLILVVSDLVAPLQHDVDKSYMTVILPTGSAVVTTATAWCAMCGQERCL